MNLFDHRRHLFGLSAGSILLALVACSGSSSTSGTTPEQACTDAAQAICDKINSCAPYFLEVGYGDTNTCLARNNLNCAPRYSANGTSATPDLTEACISDAKAASCDVLLGRTGPDSCFTRPGKLPDGAACGTDDQCLNTLCRLSNDNACGVCSSPANANADCQRDADCAHGLVCNASKCVAFGAAGAACGKGQPCLPSLACAGGACATPLASGAPCTAKENENACDQTNGYYCNPTSKTCMKVGTAATGGQCGYFNDNFVACTGGATCVGAVAAKQQPGTCQAAAADGATCDATQGPFCLTPARCVSGVCKIVDRSTCK